MNTATSKLNINNSEVNLYSWQLSSIQSSFIQQSISYYCQHLLMQNLSLV